MREFRVRSEELGVRSEELGVRSWALSIIMLLLTMTSCEHRPLEDPVNVHYIRIYIDEQIKNVTTGFYDDNRQKPAHRLPSVMRVMLCDPSTGNVVQERYLQDAGNDERGYYLEGHITADPGTYKLMVYNFGTESTLIGNDNNYNSAMAYTNNIASHIAAQIPSVRAPEDRKSVMYEPDHLFLVTDETVRIGAASAIDTLRDNSGNYFTATTCVDSYYMQVRVKGIEYVSSAVSLLSGLAEAKQLKDRGMIADRPIRIYFDMLTAGKENEQKPRTDEADVIYATFNTFGKLPDVPTELNITFDFIKTDGTTQTEVIDITPMFDTDIVRNNRWIIIDREIEIVPPEKPEGGGFSPDVEQWEDINSDIII